MGSGPGRCAPRRPHRRAPGRRGRARCQFEKRMPDLAEPFHDCLECPHLACSQIDGAPLDLGSCSSTVMPSGLSAATPARRCSIRPPTRTWKNSSRLLLEMARNFARSSSGARRLLGELEHAGVEIQPAQMAVDVAMTVVQRDGVMPTFGRDGGRRLFRRLRRLRQRHQPSSSMAPELRKTRSSAMLVTRSAMRSR